MSSVRNKYNWNLMYNSIMQVKDNFLLNHTFNELVNLPFEQILIKLNNTFLANGATYTRYDIGDVNLLLIKYSLLKGVDDIYTNPNSIFREARSLVIDLNSEEIVLCPFRKFFNLNEIDEFSLENIKPLLDKSLEIEVSNKLDGSMQQVRYWHNQFIYSGSSALDENNSLQLKLGKELFFENINLQQLVRDYPDYTIIFEALLEADPHIVHYSGSSLNLIGMRNVYDGTCKSYKEIIKLAEEYKITSTQLESYSLEQLLERRNQFLATDKEGWVINIRTKDENVRIKLKCDDYIKMHSIYNSLSSPNALIKEIADDTFDDSYSKLSESIKPRINMLREKIYKFVRLKSSIIDNYYSQLNKDVTDKEFALQVNKVVPKVFRHYMFNKRYNKPYQLLKSNNNAYIKMNDIDKFLEEFN